MRRTGSVFTRRGLIAMGVTFFVGLLLWLGGTLTARAAATFTVDSTDDTSDALPGDGLCDDGSGACTLRAAIEEANSRSGKDLIHFSIDGTGTHTIAVFSALPAIDEAVVIDGTTEPDFAATPVVELTRGAIFAADGLQLVSGGSTVRGLTINSFRNGILITGNGGNTIEGNFIGTDVTGSLDEGNSESGVRVVDSSENLIGGTTPEQRNLISGNGSFSSSLTHSGILIEGATASGNSIEGNFIGTDVTGTLPLGNGANGVAMAAPDNVVGGTEPGTGNLISGNAFSGVLAHGEDAVGNVIIGNRVGTDVDGLSAISTGTGVEIRQNAHSTVIGGTTDSARNIISGNTTGVRVSVLSGFTGPGNMIQGNYIGVAADGTALGNASRGLDIRGPSNQIGGTEGVGVGGPCKGACNVISSNGTQGVLIWTTSAADNVIQGNHVGTDPTGTLGLGNGSGGVHLAPDGTTLIGGTAPGAGNVISANGGSGVAISTSGHVVQGNLIGTDVTGTLPLGNRIGIGVFGVGSDNLIGGTDPAARNVISASVTDGISIQQGTTGTASANTVQGNYVGTDTTGTNPLGNARHGIYVEDSPGNLIGGTEEGAGNVVSASGDAGVSIFRAAGNVMQGNLVGTDVTGTTALGNKTGISLLGVANVVGGTTPGAGNLISGNNLSGVLIGSAASSTDHVVQGNLIGTDISGNSTLGNGRHGVEILGASGHIIGGTGIGAGNVIAANAETGVFIGQGVTEALVQGNRIGTSADGTTSLGNGLHGVHVVGSDNLVGGEAEAGNVIAHNGSDGIFTSLNAGNSYLGNLIHANSGLGIDLGIDGVNPNDEGDGDGGANDFQNYPVISGAVSGTVVDGTLHSTPTTTFRLEFFSNEALDPTGFGEGETYLGFGEVTTDEAGHGAFRVALDFAVPPGQYITATATNPAGSTSEFSAGQIVVENRPPVAEDDVVTVDEGGSVGGNVLTNDSDPDGDALLVTNEPVTSPSHGSVVIAADGSFTYTHDASETVSDDFIYEVCDDGVVSLCSTATVAITVAPVNDPPSAVDDPASTDEDVPVTVNVLANDDDPENEVLEVSAYDVVSTQGGTVFCTTAGDCTYTPPPDFFGADAFTYTAIDPEGLFDSATVSIDVAAVNDPPQALDDAVSTDEDVPVTVDVLANDSDPDGDALEVSEYDAVSTEGGTVSCTTAGECTYTPPGGFSGTDRFGYIAADGSGATDTAIVTVTVVATNTPPEIRSLSLPSEPLAVGTLVWLTAEFADPDADDLHTFEIDWGNGEPAEAGTLAIGERTISATHAYQVAGVFTVTVTVSDGEASDIAFFEFVVVYDPDGGFVTGGGWIDSPEGAWVADPGLTGRATFGFVSKYKKGADIPTGATEFQFRTADLNFHSSSYEWLLVTGSDYATFKGVGTINGEGEYGFIIWAGDEELDTLRIKIWSEDDDETESIVYDSGFDQELGGGSIIVHTR